MFFPYRNFLFLLIVPWLVAIDGTAGDAPASPHIIGRLLVFVNGGCLYCRQFHAEVATIYDKTRIGQRLPLTEVDLDIPDEPYERLAKRVRFVPTFVILDSQGQEQARFRGYRSEESFWADLESSFRRLECRMGADGRLPDPC